MGEEIVPDAEPVRRTSRQAGGTASPMRQPGARIHDHHDVLDAARRRDHDGASGRTAADDDDGMPAAITGLAQSGASVLFLAPAG